MESKKPAYKDIEAGGRKWRIARWSARLATYWTFKIIAGMQTSRRGAAQETILPSVAEITGSFSKADFFDFQNDCLSICSELQVMADGQTVPIPVLRVDGTFNVPDLDHDLNIVMDLVMQALMFSIGELFEGKEPRESDKQASDSTQSNL
jgi:hypothetical protein